MISVPNYQKLKSMVHCSETSIAKLWRQARENRNRNSGKESKGINRRWRRKRYLLSVERKRPVFVCIETDAVSATKPKILRKKPEHTAATPSEPTVSRGWSVSRKRSIRGKGNHGSILRQPCRYYYLKGTCTRTPCEYWHAPECQFCKSETGFKAGDKCLFPHYKIDEQPNKKPKKKLLPKMKRKRWQECCSYCEKCITTGLCITRFKCTRFSR